MFKELWEYISFVSGPNCDKYWYLKFQCHPFSQYLSQLGPKTKEMYFHNYVNTILRFTYRSAILFPSFNQDISHDLIIFPISKHAKFFVLENAEFSETTSCQSFTRVLLKVSKQSFQIRKSIILDCWIRKVIRKRVASS